MRVKNFFLGLLPVVVMEGVSMMASFFSMGLMYIIFSTIASKGEDDFMSVLSRVIEASTDPGFLMLLSLITEFLLIFVYMIWYRKASRENTGLFYISDFNFSSFISVIIGSISMCICVEYLASIIAELRPDWAETMERLQEQAGLTTGNITPFMVVFVCLVGPILEESVFRGVTYSYMKKALPVWFAIVIQAFLFALVHMNVLQGIYTFILGIIMGLVVEKTGSVVWSMMIHVIYNTSSLFIGYLPWPDETPDFIWAIILACAVLVTIIAFYFFFRGVTIKHLEIEYLTEDSQVLDLNEE